MARPRLSRHADHTRGRSGVCFHIGHGGSCGEDGEPEEERQNGEMTLSYRHFDRDMVVVMVSRARTEVHI